MHLSLNRCYLNSKQHCTQLDWWGHDTSYNLHVKQIITPQHVLGAPAAISSDTHLQFAPYHLPLGTFKVCGCDRSLNGDNPCTQNVQDYSIEIGKIHVTGTSCMHTRQIQSKRTCRNQPYNGLRCNDKPIATIGAGDVGTYKEIITTETRQVCTD